MPQSRSWRCGEVKILDPTGTWTPNPRSYDTWGYLIRKNDHWVGSEMKVIDKVVPLLNQLSRHGVGGGGVEVSLRHSWLRTRWRRVSISISGGMSLRYPFNSTVWTLWSRKTISCSRRELFANRFPRTHRSTRYTDWAIKIGCGRLGEMLIWRVFPARKKTKLWRIQRMSVLTLRR
jgi:hypothetical protein